MVVPFPNGSGAWRVKLKGKALAWDSKFPSVPVDVQRKQVSKGATWGELSLNPKSPLNTVPAELGVELQLLDLPGEKQRQGPKNAPHFPWLEKSVSTHRSILSTLFYYERESGFIVNSFHCGPSCCPTMLSFHLETFYTGPLLYGFKT